LYLRVISSTKGKALQFRWWRCALVIVVAGGVCGPAASQSPDNASSRISAAANDWAQSPHLANIHARQKFSCSTCHGDDLIPDANATSINTQCVACHGDMKQVASLYKGPSYFNPHASHLGDIACTACHFGHQESKAYCLNCHTNFNMPIPGGVATIPPSKP
jgi:fumarate reductase flavoprotein subunit